jgi:1-acyl-sn-glycerol-3-phosphate acyltransferase
LRGDTENSSFSRFMAVSWAISHCFGVPALFIGPFPLGTLFRGDTINWLISRFGCFVGYFTLFWGPQLFSGPMTLGTRFEVRHKKLVIFTFYGRFMGYSTLFWVPMLFLGPLTFHALLEGRHEKLVVFTFYGCFVCYSTMFWGPDAISRALNTQYMI